MKTLYRSSLGIALMALICFLSGLHFRQQNKVLCQSTASFDETLTQEQQLTAINTDLKKKWEGDKDILAKLSKFLITPKHEVADNPTHVYDSEAQHEVAVYENYLSGFIAYDDCVKVLEKLCEAQLPILITSLSIHRNIAYNYALQISMTYRTK